MNIEKQIFVRKKLFKPYTLHISESIWPPPFSTGVCRNEEPSPEGQRDKEISLYQFILSLFKGVGQLLPGDFAGLLMSRPGSSQLGTLVAKMCSRGFLEAYRVPWLRPSLLNIQSLIPAQNRSPYFWNNIPF